MEGEVREHLVVAPERTVIVPLAVDLEEIDRPIPTAAREATLGRLRIADETTVILSVGRLEFNKGFSVLAHALGRAKDELPHPWLWVLVGKGPKESLLRGKARDLGLVENTRFVGEATDQELAALYERANLFAHPTLYEGSSLVTLEAMAHARPVVATSVGGIPDKVKEGKSGFLVPPGNAEALAQALIKASSLGPALAELGAEGRRRVEKEFSWTERARRLVDLYQEVLSGAGPE
jgi:glycosyltransferase involved in cell wall biosynthesis